jgi:beta-galactosidase
LELSSRLDADSFVFGGEVYSGWFNDWGDASWESRNAQGFAEKIANLLTHNRSVNIFLAFGGTNFGTNAGANGFNPAYAYMPHITSYDENAPVSEHGRPTEKFYRLRNVFQNYYGEGHKLIPVPETMPIAKVTSISIKTSLDLFSNLPEPSVV